MSESLGNDIKEFWKADKELAQEYDGTLINANTSTSLETSSYNPIKQSHPQAYHTSRLLGFTKQLNDILEKEIYGYKENITCETGVSQNLGR